MPNFDLSTVLASVVGLGAGVAASYLILIYGFAWLVG